MRTARFEIVRSILEAALTFCLTVGVLGLAGVALGAAVPGGAPVA